MTLPNPGWCVRAGTDVPFLDSSERLFDGVGNDLHDLERVRTVAAPNATHLKFARR